MGVGSGCCSSSGVRVPDPGEILVESETHLYLVVLDQAAIELRDLDG